MGSAKELPRVLSFCSGYAGIERGLDLAGVEHRVLAYVEIESFAIANLVNKMEAGKLAPAPIWTDVKTLPVHLFRDHVDILTGGYPCQPFSHAGGRKGTGDPRHLWPYISHAIGAIRPRRVFFENVEGHISLGLSTVLADLEERGYDATWGIFSASEVGAPHQRKRVFIMADSISGTARNNGKQACDKGWRTSAVRGTTVRQVHRQELPVRASSTSENAGELADPDGERLEGWPRTGNAASRRTDTDELTERQSEPRRKPSWPPEPRVGRVVDGCPNRMDRIRLLGNGVVPQTAAKAWQVLDEELAN